MASTFAKTNLKKKSRDYQEFWILATSNLTQKRQVFNKAQYLLDFHSEIIAKKIAV